MNLAYNRAIASAVLAVCVVGSVFGMGGGHLKQDHAKVMHVFNEGTEAESTKRFSMDAYMDNCADYARIMAEEYRMRVSDSDGKVDELLALCDTVGEGEDLERRYSEYMQLGAQVEALYSAFFKSIPENDAAASDFKRAYRNYESDLNKFRKDDYHAMASGYNTELKGFPAGIIGSIVGAGELSLME